MFVSTVYTLNGILYILQFFFPSLKLNYQEFFCVREEIKLNYGPRFKAAVHLI